MKRLGNSYNICNNENFKKIAYSHIFPFLTLIFFLKHSSNDKKRTIYF